MTAFCMTGKPKFKQKCETVSYSKHRVCSSPSEICSFFSSDFSRQKTDCVNLAPNSNVNAVNVKTRTPLYLASLKGHVKSLRVLLASEFIDVNKGMTKDGSSAFSIASEKGQFEVMNVLLANDKTDVNKGWARYAWTSKVLTGKSSNASTETQQNENKALSGEKYVKFPSYNQVPINIFICYFQVMIV